MLKGLPNTYAYTKALTEDLVNSYSGQIPLVITRPSIGKSIYSYDNKTFHTFFLSLVTAAWKEPYPGWVEGMNGPTGLIIGAARGNQL